MTASGAAVRAVWRAGNRLQPGSEPVRLCDVRTSAHRNRTAFPSTPKGFELNVLEQFEHLADVARRLHADMLPHDYDPLWTELGELLEALGE